MPFTIPFTGNEADWALTNIIKAIHFFEAAGETLQPVALRTAACLLFGLDAYRDASIEEVRRSVTGDLDDPFMFPGGPGIGFTASQEQVEKGEAKALAERKVSAALGWMQVSSLEVKDAFEVAIGDVVEILRDRPSAVGRGGAVG